MNLPFRLLFAGLLSLTAATVSAQSKFSIGLSGTLSLPVSGSFGRSSLASNNLKWNDLASAGFGGQLHLRYHATEALRISLSTGILKHTLNDKGKKALGRDAAIQVIPITVAGDYAFGAGAFRPYLGLETGLNSVTMQDLQPAGATKKADGKTTNNFVIAPVVGGLLTINDNLSAEVSLKYQFLFLAKTTNTTKATVGNLPISLGLNYRL